MCIRDSCVAVVGHLGITGTLSLIARVTINGESSYMSKHAQQGQFSLSLSLSRVCVCVCHSQGLVVQVDLCVASFQVGLNHLDKPSRFANVYHASYCVNSNLVLVLCCFLLLCC